MKSYKILSIGNSFTQDPQRYLNAIARARGVDLKCVNLVIGGCSLERHYRNMLSDRDAYALEVNGTPTGFAVSLSEALSSDMFDFVTLQQASHYSFLPDTYTPYIEDLADFVRSYQPKAKLVIQRTWAYEEGSQRLANMGFATEKDMYDAICAAYDKAAELASADLSIPSGTAMHEALLLGLPRVHRDTFHADLGYGRYMLGLTWLATLCGLDPLEDKFCDLDVPATPEELAIVRQAAHNAVFGK